MTTVLTGASDFPGSALLTELIYSSKRCVYLHVMRKERASNKEAYRAAISRFRSFMD
jgi:hypothetical protein